MGTASDYSIYRDRQLHLGCPNVKKGMMKFIREEEQKLIWFCDSCNNHVKTILFPSYEDYKEMYRERERQAKKYGRNRT